MARTIRLLGCALALILLASACQKQTGSSEQSASPIKTDAKVSIIKPTPGQELTSPIEVALAIKGDFTVEPPTGKRVERHGDIALFLDTDLTSTVPITPTASITSPTQLTATIDNIAPGSHKLTVVLADGANSPWIDSRAEVTFTAIPTCEPNPQVGLPEPVAAKRKAIYCAAIGGDFDKVVALASPKIEYTFGMPVKGGFAAFLRAEGAEANLERIARLLNGDQKVFRGEYRWEGASKFGHRIVIDKDGGWVAYIAGD